MPKSTYMESVHCISLAYSKVRMGITEISEFCRPYSGLILSYIAAMLLLSYVIITIIITKQLTSSVMRKLG